VYPEKNLSHCHFIDHEPHMDWPGNKPGVLQWNAPSWHHSLGQTLPASYSKQRRIPGFILVISGFRRQVDENCALLGYYEASGGNFLPMFRDNLSAPSSGVKNYHYSLRNNPEQRNSLLRFFVTRLPCDRYRPGQPMFISN